MAARPRSSTSQPCSSLSECTSAWASHLWLPLSSLGGLRVPRLHESGSNVSYVLLCGCLLPGNLPSQWRAPLLLLSLHRDGGMCQSSPVFYEHTLIDNRMQHTVSLWASCPLRELHIVQLLLATHIVSTMQQHQGQRREHDILAAAMLTAPCRTSVQLLHKLCLQQAPAGLATAQAGQHIRPAHVGSAWLPSCENAWLRLGAGVCWGSPAAWQPSVMAAPARQPGQSPPPAALPQLAPQPAECQR